MSRSNRRRPLLDRTGASPGSPPPTGSPGRMVVRLPARIALQPSRWGVLSNRSQDGSPTTAAGPALPARRRRRSLNHPRRARNIPSTNSRLPKTAPSQKHRTRHRRYDANGSFPFSRNTLSTASRRNAPRTGFPFSSWICGKPASSVQSANTVLAQERLACMIPP